MTLYLGPLGRLVRLDLSPDAGDFTDEPRELGALNTALDGTETKDVFGYRRAISLPAVGFADRALSWIMSCYRGVIAGPLYYLDTRYPNRLSASVSGMAWPQVGRWSASSGSAEKTPSGLDLLTTATAEGDISVPGPSWALTWSPAAAGTLTAEATRFIPVVPGEELVFSVWALAGAPTLELVPYSADGVAGAEVTGTTVLAGPVPRRYVSYTVPASGVAAVRARIRAAGAGTVTTAAWMLSAPQEDGTPPPWVLGRSAPQVLINAVPGAVSATEPVVSGNIELAEV